MTPDITQALLPPLDMPSMSLKSLDDEPRFDIAVEKMPLRNMLMSLVEGTTYSMVVHPDIDGIVSLQLKNVTLSEALNIVRDMYGYEYRREGKRFIVLGKGLQTRVFTVNYLNINRKGRSETRVSSGELTGGGSASGGGSATGSSQKYGIEVQTNSESDFWKGLETALLAMLGAEGGRQVVLNPQAGLIVVKATPTEIKLVEEFLNSIQATVNRQVILEAKVIEVELQDRFQTGINWANLGNMIGADYLATQTGGGRAISSGASEIAGGIGNLRPDSGFSPVASAITSAFGGIFSISAKTGDFGVFVELLRSQGNVNVLSSPRVATVNNQKAVIKIGGDEFFVTNVTSTTTGSGDTATSNPSVTLTPFFSGIALDVTPQIDSEKRVVLHIHPSVSNVTQRDKNFIVSGSTFSLPLAFSTIQESDNIVRANSGEIIVIAGLMKEAATAENASVPLLGDLPLVGGLFKHQKLTRIKKELVILLKPTVVDAEEVWGNAIQASQRQINAIESSSHSR